jgi:hypothetical protein
MWCILEKIARSCARYITETFEHLKTILRRSIGCHYLSTVDSPKTRNLVNFLEILKIATDILKIKWNENVIRLISALLSRDRYSYSSKFVDYI